jgi:8-amino-3,8-dideoxy-alpha-D-manno-octulosonate transaminase
MSAKVDLTSLNSDTTKLALDGGVPVRSKPLPLEFPGVHHMDEEEVDAAIRVLRSRSPFRYYGIDLQGEVEAFESDFAAFLGVSHCLAVNSGTGALHVALAALGVGPGQEVIIPAYMWVSIAAAVVNLGAIPVLADIDDSFCMNPAALEAKITSRTTGIIVAHMSGAPADVEAIVAVARRHNLFLLEDCAQCAGGSVRGKKVGTFGDMAIFSFQMNKNMTSGEGGCVVTNSESLFNRSTACHDIGYARDSMGRPMYDRREYCLWSRGYRIDEMRAAVLRVQLRKLPRIIERMHTSKYRIRETLKKFPQVALRRVADEAGDTGCFLLTTFPTAELAAKMCQALRAEGIVTSSEGINDIVMTDWGLHIYYNIPSLVYKTGVDKARFPWFLTENRDSHTEYGKGTCPYADSLFERTCLLAIPSCLTTGDEDDIIAAFEKVIPAVADRT